MRSKALTKTSSAWALAAYLGFLLFAAPCTCLAKPVATASDSVCCCGPDAKTPCAPKQEGDETGGCDAALGAGCAQALPKATASETVSAADESVAPAPASVLSFELASPLAVLVLASRARTPSAPPPALSQVRSTVLLI